MSALNQNTDRVDAEPRKKLQFPPSGSVAGNVVSKQFYQEFPYVDLPGAISLDDYIDQLSTRGFSEILAEGRKDISHSYRLNGKHTFKSLRMSAGLTQSSLAGRIGIQQYMISKYENGQLEPGLKNLSSLARALSVTADELIEALQNHE